VSVQAITWAYQQDLPMGAKAVLVALANHADGDGVCYPGQVRLADMVGCSERALRRYLQALEGADLIERTPRRRRDGSRTSDQYQLRGYQPANVAGSAEATGQTGRANRPNRPQSPASLAGHEPSVEPSVEPSATTSADATEDALAADVAEAEKIEQGRLARTHDHQVLATAHPRVWAALGSISTARRWERDQLRAVAVRVLQLTRDHGDARVADGLQHVRANLAEIRYPLRWLEVHLQRTDQSSDGDLAALVDQVI
jgi:hypothetical protein